MPLKHRPPVAHNGTQPGYFITFYADVLKWLAHQLRFLPIVHICIPILGWNFSLSFIEEQFFSPILPDLQDFYFTWLGATYLA